jgi:hypothetical protein
MVQFRTARTPAPRRPATAVDPEQGSVSVTAVVRRRIRPIDTFPDWDGFACLAVTLLEAAAVVVPTAM